MNRRWIRASVVALALVSSVGLGQHPFGRPSTDRPQRAPSDARRRSAKRDAVAPRVADAAVASGSNASSSGLPVQGGAIAVSPVRPISPVLVCPNTIRDAATANCIGASSIPTLGSLYPQSSFFNVDPAGNVGIGTTSQNHLLEVAGDVRGTGRMAVGDIASVGAGNYVPLGATWDSVVDFSSQLTDFSTGLDWTAMRSWFEIDPSIDLTGPNATQIYSHDFEVWTAPTNAQDLEVLAGPYLEALHLGSGSVSSLWGTFMGAESFDGHVHDQAAASVYSAAHDATTVDYNTGLWLATGHHGSGGGSIGTNFGIYVVAPANSSPIGNNYGLYVEDQDVATFRNYAIFSEGGANYLAGNVGIGTLPTNYALQVGVPGDGSEARANAWNLLSSRAFKTDVEPLDGAGYEDILAKIECTEVVHYRYVDDDHRHLGVIAEESPDEILSKDKQGVSLGDYAAFLLAGLKAQQAQIRTLQDELAQLRAEVATRSR